MTTDSIIVGVFVFSTLLFGFYIVIKEEKLSKLQKAIWLFFIFTSNFLAVLAFLAWRWYDRKEEPKE